MSADPECWCEWVDIGVGMQRVTDEPTCPEHGVDAGIPEWSLQSTWHTFRQQFAALAPVVVMLAGQMSRAMWAVTGPCECPSPTHRMSCGVGATPMVVKE